jgi:hypothetical protein
MGRKGDSPRNGPIIECAKDDSLFSFQYSLSHRFSVFIILFNALRLFVKIPHQTVRW